MLTSSFFFFSILCLPLCTSITSLTWSLEMDQLLLSWLLQENWPSRFHPLLLTLALLLAFATLASSVELPKALRSVKCRLKFNFFVGVLLSWPWFLHLSSVRELPNGGKLLVRESSMPGLENAHWTSSSFQTLIVFYTFNKTAAWHWARRWDHDCYSWSINRLSWGRKD